MDPKKTFILRQVEVRARRAARRLSMDLARSAGEEKEAIRAGIELEQWLAQSCRDCLG